MLQTNRVNSPRKSDIYCRYGILYKSLCCPNVRDDTCAKSGCRVNNMAALYSMDAIIEGNRHCTNTTSPCVMDNKYLVLPHVYIDAPRAIVPGETVASPTLMLSTSPLISIEVDNQANNNTSAMPEPQEDDNNTTIAMPVVNQTKEVAQDSAEIQW